MNFIGEGNHFTGPIPTSMRNCRSLQGVWLQRNELTGNVFEGFGVDPSVWYIDLSYNRFDGELTSNLADCQNLTLLRIVGNNITGRIPSQIGQLTQLEKLDLSSNQLEEEMPKE